MRILVAILTSSKPDLARLCYDSVASHSPTENVKYDSVVIVNSIDTHHLEDVRAQMPPGTNIQETESNGKPGKGHNSVLRYFQQKPEYDYLVMVDGDDFLYPRALTRLNYYLQYEPDILFIAFHDILLSELYPKDSNIPFITFRNKCCLSYNVEALTVGEWHRVKGAINPFNRDINHMNTYARPFAFSRKSVDSNLDIYYDENAALYDDFIVFLKAFELSNLRKLNTYAAIDTNLYLYNATSLDAATKRYFSPENEPARKRENEYYQASIKNRFLTLKRWDLTRFPLLELGQNSDPDDFLAKCKYVDDLASKIRLQCMVPQRDNIDLILQHCREVGNQVFYDDLIATLEWIVDR
jgi:hypothetical protein